MQEERKEFVCSKCGACCRNIGYVEEAEFLNRGDGICKYLDEKTNLCTIYDFRPEICRVDKMFKRYKKQMTWDEYIALNYSSCEYLRKLEAAKEYRKQYPNKLRYNDVIDGTQEEEVLDIDVPEDKILVNEEKEEYLEDDDFFDDK